MLLQLLVNHNRQCFPFHHLDTRLVLQHQFMLDNLLDYPLGNYLDILLLDYPLNYQLDNLLDYPLDYQLDYSINHLCLLDHCKKNATQIIDPNVKYELKGVGILGRALALHVYFGEAVLHESTPSGNVRCNLLPLDQENLRSLVTNIHHHSSFSRMNIRDFQQLVKKKIVPSIENLCKELRTRHELKK